MHIDWKELRWPLIVFLALLLGMWIAGDVVADSEARRSMYASGFICLGHVVAGLLILDWAAGRPPTSFLKRVLGGMGVRLVVMLGLVALLLNVHAFEPSSLMLGLLGFYVVALIFEVITLQRKVTLHQENA